MCLPGCLGYWKEAGPQLLVPVGAPELPCSRRMLWVVWAQTGHVRAVFPDRRWDAPVCATRGHRGSGCGASSERREVGKSEMALVFPAFLPQRQAGTCARSLKTVPGSPCRSSAPCLTTSQVPHTGCGVEMPGLPPSPLLLHLPTSRHACDVAPEGRPDQGRKSRQPHGTH